MKTLWQSSQQRRVTNQHLRLSMQNQPATAVGVKDLTRDSSKNLFSASKLSIQKVEQQKENPQISKSLSKLDPQCTLRIGGQLTVSKYTLQQNKNNAGGINSQYLESISASQQYSKIQTLRAVGMHRREPDSFRAFTATATGGVHSGQDLFSHRIITHKDDRDDLTIQTELSRSIIIRKPKQNKMVVSMNTNSMNNLMKPSTHTVTDLDQNKIKVVQSHRGEAVLKSHDQTLDQSGDLQNKESGSKGSLLMKTVSDKDPRNKFDLKYAVPASNMTTRNKRKPQINDIIDQTQQEFKQQQQQLSKKFSKDTQIQFRTIIPIAKSTISNPISKQRTQVNSLNTQSKFSIQDCRESRGSQYFKDKLEAQRTLQSSTKYQDKIPVSHPVRLDPNSYGGLSINNLNQLQQQYNLFNIKGEDTRYGSSRVHRKLQFIGPKGFSQVRTQHDSRLQYHRNKSQAGQRHRTVTQTDGASTSLERQNLRPKSANNQGSVFYDKYQQFQNLNPSPLNCANLLVNMKQQGVKNASPPFHLRVPPMQENESPKQGFLASGSNNVTKNLSNNEFSFVGNQHQMQNIFQSSQLKTKYKEQKGIDSVKSSLFLETKNLPNKSQKSVSGRQKQQSVKLLGQSSGHSSQKVLQTGTQQTRKYSTIINDGQRLHSESDFQDQASKTRGVKSAKKLQSKPKSKNESEFYQTADGNEIAGHNLNLDAYQIDKSNTDQNNQSLTNLENIVNTSNIIKEQHNELTPVITISEVESDSSPLCAPNKLLQLRQSDENFKMYLTQQANAADLKDQNQYITFNTDQMQQDQGDDSTDNQNIIMSIEESSHQKPGSRSRYMANFHENQLSMTNSKANSQKDLFLSQSPIRKSAMSEEAQMMVKEDVEENFENQLYQDDGEDIRIDPFDRQLPIINQDQEELFETIREEAAEKRPQTAVQSRSQRYNMRMKQKKKATKKLKHQNQENIQTNHASISQHYGKNALQLLKMGQQPICSPAMLFDAGFKIEYPKSREEEEKQATKTALELKKKQAKTVSQQFYEDKNKYIIISVDDDSLDKTGGQGKLNDTAGSSATPGLVQYDPAKHRLDEIKEVSEEATRFNSKANLSLADIKSMKQKFQQNQYYQNTIQQSRQAPPVNPIKVVQQQAKSICLSHRVVQSLHGQQYLNEQLFNHRTGPDREQARTIVPAEGEEEASEQVLVTGQGLGTKVARIQEAPKEANESAAESTIVSYQSQTEQMHTLSGENTMNAQAFEQKNMKLHKSSRYQLTNYQDLTRTRSSQNDTNQNSLRNISSQIRRTDDVQRLRTDKPNEAKEAKELPPFYLDPKKRQSQKSVLSARTLTSKFKYQNRKLIDGYNERNYLQINENEHWQHQIAYNHEQHCSKYKNELNIKYPPAKKESLGEAMLQNFSSNLMQEQQQNTTYLEFVNSKNSQIMSRSLSLQDIIPDLRSPEEWYSITENIYQQLDHIFENQLDFDELFNNANPTKKDDLNDTEEDMYINANYHQMRRMYESLTRTATTDGYAKSKDFHYQEEKMQRNNEDKWMKSRGKTIEPDEFGFINAFKDKELVNGINFHKIKRANSFVCFDNNIQPLKSSVQPVSYDNMNKQIIQFCTTLFENWLEDYREYVEGVKQKNVSHCKYVLNEGLERNIRDKCLPIDYFIERMFQVGLCLNVDHIKDVLTMMQAFDPNVGFQKFSEDQQVGEDKFRPINVHNDQVDTWLRRNLEKGQFRQSDRVSQSQFISLFNVVGVSNAKRLDSLFDALERLQAIDQKALTAENKKEKQAYSRTANKKSEVHEQEDPSRRKELLKAMKSNLSVQDRHTIGRAMNMFEKRKLFQNTNFGTYDLQNCKIKDEGQEALDQERDDKFYNLVIQIFKNVQAATIKMEGTVAMTALRSKTKKNFFAKGNTNQLNSKNVHFKNPLAGEEEVTLLGKEYVASDTVVSQIRDAEAALTNLEKFKKAQARKRLEESPNKTSNFFKDLSQGNTVEKSNKMFSTQLSGIKKRLVKTNVLKDINSGLRRVMKMNTNEQEIFRQQVDLTHDKIEYARLNKKMNVKHQLLLDRINMVRKQMILEEVCRDIIKTHTIILDLIKYDNTDKMSQTDLHQRQLIRKQFKDFIVHGIRKRYGHQAFIFYDYDEQHKQIRAMEQRSIQARTLLLEISKLMISNGIQLTYDEHQDWHEELIKVEHIRVKINILVNLIAQQMVEREDNQSYPNDNIGLLIDQGKKIWTQQIDPDYVQLVPRRLIDDFLLQNKVVTDSKEIDQFLGGVLQQDGHNITKKVRKSHFLSLVYKAILRKACLRIMSFCKIGNDFQSDSASLNQQVQRLQRKILYNGILTNNIHEQDLLDKEGVMKDVKDNYQSQACKEIICNLQYLKQDKRVHIDKCKIRLMESKAQLEKSSKKLTSKVGILSEYDPYAKPATYVPVKLPVDDGPCAARLLRGWKRNANDKHQHAKAAGNLTKFEKKFPKERQDAIRSLISKDKQFCDEDKEEAEKHCKPVQWPIQLETVLSSRFRPKDKYHRKAPGNRYQRTLSLVQRQKDNASVQTALAQTAVRMKSTWRKDGGRYQTLDPG